MAYPTALSSAVRKSVRRLPARDPLRTATRGLATPAGQAATLIRSGHMDTAPDNPDADLKPSDLDTYRAAVLALLIRARADAQAIHEDHSLPVIGPTDPAQVADTAVQRLLELLRFRMYNGSDVETVPVGYTMSTMRDLAGAPEGYDPHGAGFSEIGAVAAREQGTSIIYEWVHGFFGEPKTPDPEHVYLSGTVYARPAVVDGRYVGDHPGCTCFNLPTTPSA